VVGQYGIRVLKGTEEKEERTSGEVLPALGNDHVERLDNIAFRLLSGDGLIAVAGDTGRTTGTGSRTGSHAGCAGSGHLDARKSVPNVGI
jgi:hypothetical protein